MRLTKRGKRLVTVLMVVGFVALVLWLNWLLTPDKCMGDPATLSQFCKDLLYP